LGLFLQDPDLSSNKSRYLSMLPLPFCRTSSFVAASTVRSRVQGREMKVAAILVVTWVVQGETSSPKQFDFPSLALCEAVCDKVEHEYKRAAAKDPAVPEIIATLFGF
jgi:hypothetical protein